MRALRVASIARARPPPPFIAAGELKPRHPRCITVVAEGLAAVELAPRRPQCIIVVADLVAAELAPQALVAIMGVGARVVAWGA